ncbi:tyrosine-type recombinase/integrase [Variovorax rhizosphaerae]|uniref:tyrosine-type recombinase/integrase n=1 Tax=Variovorax rhizosphaerae TaxID=1836200 RepID=UPI003BF616C4
MIVKSSIVVQGFNGLSYSRRSNRCHQVAIRPSRVAALAEIAAPDMSLTGLRCDDIVLGVGAHVRCEGKGRKRRCTPLRKDTVRVIRDWLREREGQPSNPSDHARNAPEPRRAAGPARQTFCCGMSAVPIIGTQAVTPHVLRHTLAMDLLHHGAGQTVIRSLAGARIA